MIKILITGVGSLVGQNILDVLEMRRSNLTIVGINSVAETQRNFRCDTVYLVPPTEHFSFEDAFDKIFQLEQPDFVFAGRDIDVVFLAKFREKNPWIGNRIPCGGSNLARIMHDKYSTYCFAREHGLPFAETFLFRNQDDIVGINDFTTKLGFPLIVKPRFGFGSHHVFFLTDYQQLNALIAEGKEFLIQEYLNPDEDFNIYLREYQKGMSLFFQIPDSKHFVSQIILSPGHELLGSLSTHHVMEGGKAIFSEIHVNEQVNQLIKNYTEIFCQLGWVGFMNIQYKPDGHGKWKVFEINPRMTGATSSRFHLGLDEIGLLIQSIRPDCGFSSNFKIVKQEGVVLKYLTDYFLPSKCVSELIENKIWKKSADET